MGNGPSSSVRTMCSSTGSLAPSIYTKYNTQYVRPVERPVSVPHALLALLSEGPKYGLRLQNEFEARTGEVWPLNVGQVYTTLQRLERDGLVETDDGERERSRKRYRITSAGAHELADWLRTPPDLVPPPRDELVIKVLVALQVPGTDIREILQVHRRHVIEIMQRYTKIKAAAAEDDLPLALVADAELFRLEAIVRWLDAAEVRLKRLPSLAPAVAADVPLEPTRPLEVSQ
jgi:DNA-binding PadR family transcriptional regulator